MGEGLLKITKNNSMKKLIFVFVALTILFSCSEEPKQSIQVESLFSDWVELTENNGKQVIYSTCDGGNTTITIRKLEDSFMILLHGTQEDNMLIIREAYKKTSDTIYFTTVYKGTDQECTQKLVLTDSTKQIASWHFKYLDMEFTKICVNSKNQNAFEFIKQPCRECFEDEICAEWEKRDSLTKTETPFQTIKRIFDDYVEYEEGTDDEKNKEDMKIAFSRISLVNDYKEFEILLNAWMYYDPTDFSIQKELINILNKNKPKSIEAIKKRLINKRENENEKNAPYIDLITLLKEIENAK